MHEEIARFITTRDLHFHTLQVVTRVHIALLSPRQTYWSNRGKDHTWTMTATCLCSFIALIQQSQKVWLYLVSLWTGLFSLLPQRWMAVCVEPVVHCISTGMRQWPQLSRPAVACAYQNKSCFLSHDLIQVQQLNVLTPLLLHIISSLGSSVPTCYDVLKTCLDLPWMNVHPPLTS